MLKTEKGFTLLEMVIGVMIVSIISVGISESIMSSIKVADDVKEHEKEKSTKNRLKDSLKSDLLEVKVDDLTNNINLISDTELEITTYMDEIITYRYIDNKIERIYNLNTDVILNDVENFKFTFYSTDENYSLEVLVNDDTIYIPIDKNRWSYKKEFY